MGIDAKIIRNEQESEINKVFQKIGKILFFTILIYQQKRVNRIFLMKQNKKKKTNKSV